MIREFTVRDYAQREQVSRHTVRNWIAKGALETRRTPGGHFRIIERQGSNAVVISLQDAAKRTN